MFNKFFFKNLGCPFKHLELKNLEMKLNSFGLNDDQVLKVINF